MASRTFDSERCSNTNGCIQRAIFPNETTPNSRATRLARPVSLLGTVIGGGSGQTQDTIDTAAWMPQVVNQARPAAATGGDSAKTVITAIQATHAAAKPTKRGRSAAKSCRLMRVPGAQRHAEFAIPT